MPADAFDVVVVGSGPGGYVAAIRAAQLGLRTAVVEREGTVGGRCLNHACIPAKAVLRSADLLSEVAHAAELGIEVDGAPRVDWGAIGARRARVIETLTGGVAGLLKKNGVALVAGTGTLTPEGDVRVGDRVLSAARATVLATGSVRAALPGLDYGGNVIGTEEAWRLDALPATMAVIGAGASGAEIASAYARLGTAVTLYEGLDRVLPTEDEDISKVALRGLRAQGIDVRTGTFYDGQEADWVVIAAGRAPDVADLGLDAAGVARDERGLVAVDGTLCTSHPKVYAIGDLVPGPALAHKASEEGVIAVEAAAGLDPHPLALADIPRATFCTPNVGSFGLTERQARDAGHDVAIGKVPYGAVGAGTVYGDRAGLIKVIGDRATGELLGGHVVGAKATELIQELVTAKLAEAGYADVARMIHGHPTLSEGILEAARAADGWLIHG
ncbi:MAG TPA: dihydrolipoyl dehydrogenase [Baekduia sp.]|uniref:dihydrolipoyl dehydrogenase n=1 Tax=Baekduia sp. TaxID=2600305 RepID=UPI002D7848D9|nr:dihydrolipoyl dehydrogenase [Baekduia sp.]HET6508002.1 dihydrolipoyl dehydrogenase [Baekduia sp.]